MIPVYNNSNFLETTLHSVLKQSLPESNMQIEVVDDCSTDADVSSIVSTVGGGRVSYFRQSRNVGSLLNFQTCIERARGRIIHLLHADDVIAKNFYDELESLFNAYPGIGAAFCRFNYIDENGRVIKIQSAEAEAPCVLKDWPQKIAKYNRIQYAAVAVKRDVYEDLGSFFGVDYGEDWEMWNRIASKYPVAYSPQVLASYRKHSSSISGKKIATGQYIDDLVWVMNKIQLYLPEAERKQTLSFSRKYYARYAIETARHIFDTSGDRKASLVSIRKAVYLDPGFTTWKRALKLIGKALFTKYK
jgi:glycosyltransferase involved in cell wall biosynthesis